MLRIFLLLGGVFSVPTLPTRIIHWINPFCVGLNGKAGNKCLETSKGLDSILKSNLDAARVACHKLKNDKDVQKGFYLLTYTTGSFVVRTLLHKCPEVRPLIKRIVFVNSPHLGIQKVPENHIINLLLQSKEALLKITKDDIRKALPILTNLEASIVLIGAKAAIAANIDKYDEIVTLLRYLMTGKVENPDDAWVTKSGIAETFNFGGRVTPFLRDLNDPKYDKFYSGIDVIINVKSIHDWNYIIPHESVTFGAKLNEDRTMVEDATDVEFYQKHPQGIGGLYSAGKFWNCLSTGALEFLKHHETNAIKNILFADDPTAPTYAISAKRQLDKFLKAWGNSCNGKGYK